MLYPCFSDKKRTSYANIFGFYFMESMQGKYVKKNDFRIYSVTLAWTF